LVRVPRAGQEDDFPAVHLLLTFLDEYCNNHWLSRTNCLQQCGESHLCALCQCRYRSVCFSFWYDGRKLKSVASQISRNLRCGVVKYFSTSLTSSQLENMLAKRNAGSLKKKLELYYSYIVENDVKSISKFEEHEIPTNLVRN
jgi:hypothetical protein